MGHIFDNLKGKIADVVEDITKKTGDLKSDPDDKAVDIDENAGGMKAGLADSVGEMRDNTEQLARKAADTAQTTSGALKDPHVPTGGD